MSARRRAAAAAAAAALLAACSGSDGSDSATDADVPGHTGAAGGPTTCPLTGEDAPDGVDLRRPAIAVKVENPPEARPQSGLERADVVVEERVEGGITRFLVVFHCDDAARVGPIRSARFDDPKIAKPFTAFIAASGANEVVEREIRKRDMTYVDEKRAKDGELFRWPAGADDVHSLYANATKLLQRAERAGLEAPRHDVLDFGPPPDGAKDARRVTLNFVGDNTIEYRWQDGAWRRYEAGRRFTTKGGGQVAVPNVLVQEIRVDNSDTLVDVSGAASPEFDLVGRGRALLFRDGKVVAGEWRIERAFAAPEYTTRSGDAMTFAEGPVWIALVPSRAGEVKGKIAYR